MAVNGTIAYVQSFPPCDLCVVYGTPDQKKSPSPSMFDFQTKGGPWAWGCESHWEEYRRHKTLGVGMGQRLELLPPEESANPSDPEG